MKTPTNPNKRFQNVFQTSSTDIQQVVKIEFFSKLLLFPFITSYLN